jgi:opacity protein-like surface antigen
MKRILAAVSLVVLSASAVAAESSAPYEQTQFDRGVYNVEQNASAGNTSESRVWENDHNFIAPAQ